MSLPKRSAPYWFYPPFSIFWHSGTLALNTLKRNHFTPLALSLKGLSRFQQRDFHCRSRESRLGVLKHLFVEKRWNRFDQDITNQALWQQPVDCVNVYVQTMATSNKTCSRTESYYSGDFSIEVLWWQFLKVCFSADVLWILLILVGHSSVEA